MKYFPWILSWPFLNYFVIVEVSNWMNTNNKLDIKFLSYWCYDHIFLKEVSSAFLTDDSLTNLRTLKYCCIQEYKAPNIVWFKNLGTHVIFSSLKSRQPSSPIWTRDLHNFLSVISVRILGVIPYFFASLCLLFLSKYVLFWSLYRVPWTTYWEVG